ncbi:MAG TPA: PDZ domain-containing protein, partial [Chloroflexia bacterium]|nr:PDZ domain-containing protein [Chloroflexia bacterium]
AAKAGLVGADPTTGKAGDVVTAIDGNAVARVEDLTSYLDNKKVGDTVTLQVWRDGKSLDLKVTLAAWPEQTSQSVIPPSSPNSPNSPNLDPGQQAPQTQARVWLGIQGLPLDATLAGQLKVSITQGVVIMGIQPGSPAEKAGLTATDPSGNGTVGDIITAVDGKPVTSSQDINSLLATKTAGDTVTVTAWHNGQTRDVKVTLDTRPSGSRGGTVPGFPFGLPEPPAAPTTTP